MWAVIKYDKNRFNIFYQDLKSKAGSDTIIYCPKILIRKYKKNKLITHSINILGDYAFCFNKKLGSDLFVHKLKFCKGLKYILNGFSKFQNDISKFIEKCSDIEDKDGYLSQSLCETNFNSTYKFLSGPFINQIFKIINLSDKKINIKMGNLKTTIKKKDFLYSPI